MCEWPDCCLTASSYAARRLGQLISIVCEECGPGAIAFPPASRVSISELLGIRDAHGFLVDPKYLGVLAQYSRYSSPNTLARCCSSVLTIMWAITR